MLIYLSENVKWQRLFNVVFFFNEQAHRLVTNWSR